MVSEETEQALQGRGEKAVDWLSDEKGYSGETYYNLPAIKPSYYGWLVVAYLFIGGLASACQFLATVIDLFGRKEDRGLVRAGRYVALLGSMVSPFLLITDLHTPQRWYNMLRIYRKTSPMSIGAFALFSFGTLSGAVSVGQILEDLGAKTIGRWISRAASLPAALAGGVVSIYTGTLLAATNLPLWSSAFPYVSSLFASSAASTAGAALSLAASTNITPSGSRTRRRLSWFTLISGISELLFALLIERNWRRRRVSTPIQEEPLRTGWHVGVLGIGIIGPLIIHLAELITGRESRRLSSLASISMLVGGFILRAVFVFGGNRSAARPGEYFHVSQPGISRQMSGNGRRTKEVLR
jgi:formate-dependent nitrite reductase membrane component NrfD